MAEFSHEFTPEGIILSLRRLSRRIGISLMSELVSYLKAITSSSQRTSQLGAGTPGRAGVLLGLLVLLLVQSGCASTWDRVRERERLFALESGRTQAKRGQCGKALVSMDRAQARIDIGAYARESVIARARCYEKLGLVEYGQAHRRLITDFYTDEPMAYPDARGTSVFRVKALSDGGYDRPPAWLEVPSPRYTEYARRSKIIGRVVVAFELAGNNKPRRVRVLEMPHPLLASWAIEAVLTAKPKKKDDAVKLMPGGRYVTTFVFEWRWAKEETTNELDS